ncbi:MAG: lysophospholipid acyltransferase family protein [Bacteroidales bacterium]
MIPARHNPLSIWFFGSYSRLRMRLHFRFVRLRGESPANPRAHSLLVIANHFSWWDGFLIHYLNRKLYRKRFHFMMLEDQLRRHRFLNQCGGYSVRKQSRDVLESLDSTLQLLRDPDNLVLLFPQGEIRSAHSRPFRFQKGTEHILRRVPAHARVLLVANLTDYFSHPRPGLTIRYRWMDPGSLTGPGQLAEAYNRFYEDCVTQQRDR